MVAKQRDFEDVCGGGDGWMHCAALIGLFSMNFVYICSRPGFSSFSPLSFVLPTNKYTWFALGIFFWITAWVGFEKRDVR